MIKEYFDLIAARKDCQRHFEYLNDQIAALRDRIHEVYRPPYNDVVVRSDDRYYLISGTKGIQQIDLIEEDMA